MAAPKSTPVNNSGIFRRLCGAQPSSGLSGAEFAKLVGVKYQTFDVRHLGVTPAQGPSWSLRSLVMMQAGGLRVQISHA